MRRPSVLELTSDVAAAPQAPDAAAPAICSPRCDPAETETKGWPASAPKWLQAWFVAFNSSITALKSHPPQLYPFSSNICSLSSIKRSTNNGTECLRFFVRTLVEGEKGEGGGDLETLSQFYWGIM